MSCSVKTAGSNGVNGHTPENILTTARRLRRAGLSILPILGDGSKAPAVGSWEGYQKVPAAEDALPYLFRDGVGVGIVGGKVSGGLAIVDVEFEDYRQQFAELVNAERPGLLARLPEVKTPGKDEGRGRHWYLRSEQPVRTGKLARLTPEEAERRTGDRGKITAIEIKAEGGYVLCPGCPPECHPSGRLYEHVGGPPITETPVLEDDEVEVLLRCAKALDRPQATVDAAQEAARLARLCGTVTGTRPGDLFNQRGTWDEAFGSSGWKRDRLRGDTQYYTRPGKDCGISASTGYCRNDQSGDLLYVFTSNAEPLQEGRCYSKFTVFCLLQHGGIWRNAALAVVQMGYRPERREASTPAAAAEEDHEAEDGEVLADLLEQADVNADLALAEALSHAEALARLHLNDRPRLEAVYLELQQGGLTARQLQSLRQAVNAVARDRKQQRQKQRQADAAAGRAAASTVAARMGFGNYIEEEVIGDNGLPGLVRRGLSIQTIARRVNDIFDDWPRRVNDDLFAEDVGPKPRWLENPAQVGAWISQRLPEGGQNLYRWAQGDDMVTEARFFEHLRQTVRQYAALECHPHYPPMPGHFYMHPPVQSGNGRYLRRLLGYFRPATLIDRDLIKAFFLTLCWGGAPGSRPAWLFTAKKDDPRSGRGVGKSTVGQMGGQLFGGFISLSTGDKYRDLIARLLSSEAMTQRVVLLDNLKSLRLSWAELEALITTPTISGYALFKGEGRRPNTLSVVMTVNGASISRDLAQRCIVVVLDRPEFSASWRPEVEAFVEAHRWEIIGDIMAELQQPARPLENWSRWATWEAEILARACPEPCEAQKVILERQEGVDDDDAESDLVREHLLQRLRDTGNGDPVKLVYFLPAALAADWVNTATGEKRARNRASAYLNTLTITELTKHPYGRGNEQRRGYWWHGKESAKGAEPIVLEAPLGA